MTENTHCCLQGLNIKQEYIQDNTLSSVNSFILLKKMIHLKFNILFKNFPNPLSSVFFVPDNMCLCLPSSKAEVWWKQA